MCIPPSAMMCSVATTEQQCSCLGAKEECGPIQDFPPFKVTMNSDGSGNNLKVQGSHLIIAPS